MAKINLRPWREELRAEKQKQFVVMILGAAFIAVGLTFLWKTDMDNRIAYQESRNAYIETATKQLDKQIKEIEDLKRKRDELLSRMQVIQDSRASARLLCGFLTNWFARCQMDFFIRTSKRPETQWMSLVCRSPIAEFPPL